MTPNDAAIIANEVRYLTQRFDEYSRRTDERFDGVDHRLEAIDATLRSHNGRLRAVEAGWERAKGAMAAAGASKPFVLLVFGALVGVVAERVL